MPGENHSSTSNTKKGQEGNPKSKITPELVRQVAERVYRMLRDDLQRQRERVGIGSGARTGGFRG